MMTHPADDPVPAHRPARRRVFKAPSRMALATALITVLCVAAACGGRTVTTQQGGFQGAPEPTPAPASPAVRFTDTRPGAGIVEAGGDPRAVSGADPCQNPGSAAGQPITISYVGADLAELAAIGFERSIVEDPVHIISAYVNEVNFNGGIHGRCVELATHLWSLTDPLASFIKVCASMSESDPLFGFSFQLYDPGLHCTTFGTPIPTVGLYSAVPESVIAESGYVLYVDDGSVEHLLARTVEVGQAAGVIDRNDRVGLLQGSGPSAGVSISTAEEVAGMAGIDIVTVADVPSDFGDLSLLLPEQRVGLLTAGLSETQSDRAQRNLESLPSSDRAQLAEIEGFYTDAASRFDEAEVSVVIAMSHWADMRRMMRAAELIDWTPTWLINDMQPATLTTANAPVRQVHNLRQVSSRRAAGDLVPALDQGCIILRNSASEAEPFSHRPHTDAWNLITSICDYLDVAFSALTRIDGSVNHATFVEALNGTNYDAGYGGLITFSEADRNGAERFRVLAADSGCVLNYWGCMRSTTDWLDPVHSMHHVEVGADQISDMMEDLGHGHGDHGDHGDHGGHADSADSETDMDSETDDVEHEADAHDHG